MNRNAMIAAGAAVLLAAFGGGFLTAKTVDHVSASRAGGGAEATGDRGIDWPFFGKPRGAGARRAGPARPEGFAVWRNRIDTSGAQPMACIELTRPLDPAKPYGDYVLVSPATDAAPAVRVRGSELCVAGLGFDDRRVTLLKGLPAKTGEQLAANADVDFTFGDKPAYVGFAGDGVILPREEADGVGIETINVTMVAIEVWRVPDRNLVRRQIVATDPVGEGDYESDYESRPDEEGRIVWKGRLAVRGDPGQRATTVFPLGAVLKDMKPGGYVIKARDASGGRDVKAGDDEEGDATGVARASRWVMFTDLALTAYNGSDGADVTVRSLKTAKPQAGVRVALVARNGEDLAWAQADSGGRVRFAKALLEGKGAAQPKMLMAYGAQGDLAVLDMDRPPVDLSNQGVGGRMAPGAGEGAIAGRSVKTPLDAYVYADRDIYRPGETVHLVAMIRDQQAKAVKERNGLIVITRPSGVEFRKVAFTKASAGAPAYDLVLPKTAPRGRWKATVKMEGIEEAVGALSFQVEDFAPQRLAVTVGGQETVPVGPGQTRRLDVMARFLYGAAGAGLQVQGEARLRADNDPFPAFKDYRWGDAQAGFEEKLIELGATVTDAEGRAELAVDPAQGADAQAPLEAAVTASVFEPGGRPVREGVTLKVRPRPVYLGVKVEEAKGGGRDPTMAFDLVAVDGAGRRIADAGVRWSLVSENWDYDWFQQDGKWQWRRTSRDVVVASGAVDIAAGGPAKLARRLGWGDYRLVLESATGSKTVARFSAGWGAPAKEAEAPDFVRVSAGAGSHAQGDTVEIAIKAPYAGEAQVAVATDRLIDFKTFSVPAGGATLKLKTSAAWGGGAYVLVTVIQPRDPKDSPKPKRALGLAYVPLDPKGRKLTVDLGAPSKLRAKAALEVPVQVRGLRLGQRARVTVAAVDEGILQLTKFDSPDPAKWYFGKRALTVDYRDDYGRLLDPNLGAPANVNFGGDEIGGEGLTVTPIRTVALWSGVVETGLDGKAMIRLPAADFNGQLRLMAVAWTDEAVGSGVEDVVVREPVVAELNLPRFLSPGDRAMATLELHNLEGKPGGYMAEVSGAGGVVATLKKLFALVVGQRTTQLIPLTAPSSTGISRVGYRVTGPGFADARDYPIQTRLGWGPITRTYVESQGPGQAFTPPSAMMAGLAAGSVTLQVSYSPFRGFDPGPIAVSLIRYPYGCTEQLVSGAYPLLYAGELATGPRAQVNAGLSQAIGRLLDRQTLDGAFGLWRVGDGEADPWLGAFATDFLIEAQARGAPVPQSAIDRALSAMRQVSKPDGWSSVSYRLEYPGWWASSPDESKTATLRMRSRASAYALYVLAKGRKGDLARLRWYHDVQFKTEGSPLARAQVGAGLAMMGDRARAHSAFVQAVRALGYRDAQDWYQSPLRDLSAVIALAYEAGETRIARDLQGRLSGAVSDPDSLNTQEQARLLQAAHFMLAASGPITVEATGAMALTAAGGAPRWSVGRLADARFVNRGAGALWRTVTVRGTPVSAPAAQAEGVSVTKRLFTLQGAPADLGRLAQGDRVIVLISGVNGQARTVPLVVDDPLPAGFEIETVLGAEDAANGPFKFLGELSGADVQEARDDRYVAAMDLGGKTRFAFAYIARAVTPGEFFAPGVEARDMYRPTVFARTAGGRATIGGGL